MLSENGTGSDMQMYDMESSSDREKESGIKDILMWKKMKGPMPGQPDGFYGGPPQHIDGPGGGNIPKKPMDGLVMGGMGAVGSVLGGAKQPTGEWNGDLGHGRNANNTGWGGNRGERLVSGQGGMLQMLMNLFGGQRKPSMVPQAPMAPMSYGNDNRMVALPEDSPAPQYNGPVGDVPRKLW